MPDNSEVSARTTEALGNLSRRVLKALEAAEAAGWTDGSVLVKVTLHRPPPPKPQSGSPCPTCSYGKLMVDAGKAGSGGSVCRNCFMEGRSLPLHLRAEAAGWPFEAVWKMNGKTPAGRPSWGFVAAVAPGGQRLNEKDLLKYLDDPATALTQLATEGMVDSSMQPAKGEKPS